MEDLDSDSLPQGLNRSREDVSVWFGNDLAKPCSLITMNLLGTPSNTSNIILVLMSLEIRKTDTPLIGKVGEIAHTS